MFPVTYTTLDLHVLQLVLGIIPHLLLLLPILLPRYARPEDDVLSHTRCVEGGASRVSFFHAEFCPAFTFGDARIYFLCFDGGADTACGLYSLAFVVEAVGHDIFGAIFVRGDSLGGQGRGVVEFIVVGPVGAAMRDVSIVRLRGADELLSLYDRSV